MDSSKAHRWLAHGLLAQQRRLASRMAPRLGRGEAEDLASEAVSRGLARPAPDGRQGPWIERIFRNLVVDRVRHRRRAAARLALCTDDGAGPTPEDLLLEAERRHALRRALPDMAAPERDALVARFFDEAAYDDLAAHAGVPAATVRTRVHRGLGVLRARLGRLRCWLPAPGLSPSLLSGSLAPAVLTVAVVVAPLLGPEATPPQRDAITVAQLSPTSRAPRSSRSPGTSVPQRAEAPAPAPASATEHRSPNVRPAETQARHASSQQANQPPPAVMRINYGDDEVAGVREFPDDLPVTGDPEPAAHPSLIEIPRSFIPAIAKMLDDI